MHPGACVRRSWCFAAGPRTPTQSLLLPLPPAAHRRCGHAAPAAQAPANGARISARLKLAQGVVLHAICARSNSDDRNSWASCCCRTRRAACRAPRAEEATAAPSDASNVARKEEKKSSMQTAFLLDRGRDTARPCARSSSGGNSRASAASARSVGVDSSCGSCTRNRCRSSATNGSKPRSACSVALAKHRLPLLTNPRRSKGAAREVSCATSQDVAAGGGAALVSARATRAGGVAPAGGAVCTACARASSTSAACRRRGFAHGLHATAFSAGAPPSAALASAPIPAAAPAIAQARTVARMRTRLRLLKPAAVLCQGGSPHVVLRSRCRRHRTRRERASCTTLYRRGLPMPPPMYRTRKSSPLLSYAARR